MYARTVRKASVQKLLFFVLAREKSSIEIAEEKAACHKFPKDVELILHVIAMLEY